MLYKSETIRELCEQSFAKSGDQWYKMFAKAAEDFQDKGRSPLDDARETIETVESTGEIDDGEACHAMDGDEAMDLIIKRYEDKMPTEEEAVLWLRDVIQPFARPKRRGRGATNWEKVQVIKDDAFKVAILKLMRILNAVDWARNECTDREENAGNSDVDHFTDTGPGWSARGESIDNCEDLDDWFPGSEELKTWLEQIESLTFMEQLEPSDMTLEEYAD
jgi:hypothetical protein